MRSYADGREVDVLPDGTRDVTAHVAIDSVAVSGRRDPHDHNAMRSPSSASTGPDHRSSWPPATRAHTSLALTRATQAAELRARGGWGDFVWALSDTRDVEG